MIDKVEAVLTEYDLTGKQLINGQWSAAGSDQFTASSPVDNAAIGPVYSEATDDEVDLAVHSAAKAFREGDGLSVLDRVAFLEKLAESLERSMGRLLEQCVAETGYPVPRAKGELVRTIQQTRDFARLLREGSWVDARIDRGDPSRRPFPKPDIRSMMQPLGVVGVIGASNFPFAISVVGTDTVTALAAGCTVVVKGHPAHPGTCEMLAEVLRLTMDEFDFPEGSFSLLQGRDNSVGERMVTHPELSALAFTGSEAGGRALCRHAALRDQPIPVFAEMGSVNPVLVLPNATEQRCDAIAEGFVGSLLLGGGQFCTNPGMLLIPKTDAGDQLLERLSERIRGSAPPTLLHEGIAQSYRDGLVSRQAELAEDWVESESAVQAACGGLPALGVVDARAVTDRLIGELFGPFSLVVRWESQDELCELMDRLPGQLTTTVHCVGNEEVEFARVIRLMQIRSGRFLMNGFPTGVEPGDAMHHGGPFPAASLPHFTSIGMASIERFVRRMCYQDIPESLLPMQLWDSNPTGIMRRIDGQLTREAIEDPSAS